MNEFFRVAVKLGSQALASKFAESIAEEFLKTRPSLTEQHKGIVNNLLREALANGLVADHEIIEFSKPASEGSTAELVAITSADIRFAVKIDDDEKLVREALLLSAINGRSDLPKGFSERFPKVYAIKNDTPPYAYIMQAFNRRSYAEYIYKGKGDDDEIKRIGSAVLDALIPAYGATVNRYLKPSITGLYLDRIDQRLKLARSSDDEFKEFSRKAIEINGEKFDAPENYLKIIKNNIDKFEAPFTTFTHGDCHPENILVEIDRDNREIDVKFIDTKDWYEGDYIFDVGKLCHYLEVTGPAEMVKNQPVPNIDMANSKISYKLEIGQSVESVIDSIGIATRKFAEKHNDVCWKERYLLSMASNLLGLPAGRLEANTQEKKNSAFILYAEGIRYLAKCCERLDN